MATRDEYTGPSLAGMREALLPQETADKQFGAMEQQGRKLRSAIEPMLPPGGSWGLGSSGPAGYIPPKGGAATAPEAPQSRAIPAPAGRPALEGPEQPAYDKALVSSQRTLDGAGLSSGSAYSSAPALNSPLPSAMQQPTSFGASNPWKDMSQQLASMSQQRTSGYGQPMGGVAILGDMGNGMTRQDMENAETTRRWRMDDIASKVPYEQRGALMAQMFMNDQRDQTTQRGQDFGQQDAVMRAGLAGRGQDMHHEAAMGGLDAQRAGQGIQARGQDIQARGQDMNAGLSREKMAHDYTQAMDAERMKQQDPYRIAAAEGEQARAGLYGAQTDLARNQLNVEKNPHYQMAREMDNHLTKRFGKDLTLVDPKEIEAEKVAYAKMLYAQQRQQPQQGYADGGQVESPEQLMARMSAKYGAAPSTPAQQPPPPAPQQPAVQPQAQPQKAPGIMDRLRNVATGGLDRRMQGYADGGEIDAMRAKIAAYEANGQGYTKALQSGQVQQGYDAPGAIASGSAGAADRRAGNFDPYSDRHAFEDTNPLAESGGYGSGISRTGGAGNGATPSWQQPGDQGLGGAQATQFGSQGSFGSSSRMLQDNPQNTNYNFAGGGSIDVGGRQVLGAGTGKSDSLPAHIDGEHPAALSDGEFVMPIETVRHFGLDKLNKMVAASRKGLDTGR